MGITMELYKKASSMSNAHAKALAYYLFRGVIEKAHAKYKISQEDIKEMCKDAVNRAALYIKLCDDPKLIRAFLIEAMDCSQWDEPEMTQDILEDRELYERIATELD